MSDLVVGEVRGYRAWRVSDGFLASVSMFHGWDSTTNQAACLFSPVAGDHPAPAKDCTCGLYAYYRATTVPPTSSGQEVFGVVAVAGRVILATDPPWLATGGLIATVGVITSGFVAGMRQAAVSLVSPVRR